MRLKKLLLGSAAVVFSAGVASTAQAADPQGLVVTTMANYVEQCNDGDGWTKGDWCITLSGGLDIRFTYGTTIEYSLDPWHSYREYEGDETPETDMNKWGNFAIPTNGLDLSFVATRETEHGDLTVRIPIQGNAVTTEITVGPWRFRANGVRYQQSFGPAQVTVTVQNPGTLGWTDPRFEDSTAEQNIGYLDDDDELLGPWPDVQVELGFDAGFADLDFGVNVGRRGGPYGDPFLTWGGYATADLDVLGGLLLRFDWDKVNAADDGTAEPVYAYGLRADLDIDIGDRVTLAPAVGWSRNYGYYGYKYDEHELGTYWFAELDLDIELSDTVELGFLAQYSSGPNRPWDRVLDLQAQVTFSPASASPLEITLTVDHERQLFDGTINCEVAANTDATGCLNRVPDGPVFDGTRGALSSTRFTAGVAVTF